MQLSSRRRLRSIQISIVAVKHADECFLFIYLLYCFHFDMCSFYLGFSSCHMWLALLLQNVVPLKKCKTNMHSENTGPWLADSSKPSCYKKKIHTGRLFLFQPIVLKPTLKVIWVQTCGTKSNINNDLIQRLWSYMYMIRGESEFL